MGRNHIVLVGAMGSGKTTVGMRVATALGRPFVDSDAQIEVSYGATGRELAARLGVAWLHEAEAVTFSNALESTEPAVIAAAASIADRAELVASLESNGVFVVLLDAEFDVLVDRTKRGNHRRAVDWTDMSHRMERRLARFAEVADVVIPTSSLDPDSVVAEVLGAFAKRGF